MQKSFTELPGHCKVLSREPTVQFLQTEKRVALVHAHRGPVTAGAWHPSLQTPSVAPGLACAAQRRHLRNRICQHNQARHPAPAPGNVAAAPEQRGPRVVRNLYSRAVFYPRRWVSGAMPLTIQLFSLIFLRYRYIFCIISVESRPTARAVRCDPVHNTGSGPVLATPKGW